MGFVSNFHFTHQASLPLLAQCLCFPSQRGKTAESLSDQLCQIWLEIPSHLGAVVKIRMVTLTFFLLYCCMYFKIGQSSKNFTIFNETAPQFQTLAVPQVFAGKAPSPSSPSNRCFRSVSEPNKDAMTTLYFRGSEQERKLKHLLF